jgi:hypothetical protein
VFAPRNLVEIDRCFKSSHAYLMMEAVSTSEMLVISVRLRSTTSQKTVIFMHALIH